MGIEPSTDTFLRQKYGSWASVTAPGRALRKNPCSWLILWRVSKDASFPCCRRTEWIPLVVRVRVTKSERARLRERTRAARLDRLVRSDDQIQSKVTYGFWQPLIEGLNPVHSRDGDYLRAHQTRFGK